MVCIFGRYLQVARLIRTNVFPVFLLTVGVFVWCVIEFVGKFFPILAFLRKAVYFIGGACSGKKKKRAVMRPGKSIRSRCAKSIPGRIFQRGGCFILRGD